LDCLNIGTINQGERDVFKTNVTTKERAVFFSDCIYEPKMDGIRLLLSQINSNIKTIYTRTAMM
jgi:ATP-dependent DNA ligase